MAVYANLTVDQGTDFSSAVDVTDSDGDPVSLVGYTVLANKLIVWIKANPKIINTISACVIILIAIIIAFTQQY